MSYGRPRCGVRVLDTRSQTKSRHLSHECDLEPGHTGNHRCRCGYTWTP